MAPLGACGFALGGALQQVATRAGAHRGEHRGVIVVHRQDQHGGAREALRDLARGLDAVQIGHLQVHHDDVRPQRQGEADRLTSVDGLTDHLDPLERLEQRPETAQDEDDVARAIAAVSRGEAIFGPAVAGRLLQFFAAGPESAALPFPQLTAREREILDLMAGGLTNAEIGQLLFLSSKTVSNNVSVIFDKLQVAGRPKAIVQARNAGLGRTELAESDLDNDRGKPLD